MRDLVQVGDIEIQSCQDPEQTVVVLTMVLVKPKHQRHVSEMDLHPHEGEWSVGGHAHGEINSED